MRQRGTFRRIITIVILLAVAIPVVPYLLEQRIAAGLNTESIRTELANAVHRRTGLHLQVQGLRFDLLRGIVLNGAAFYEEKTDDERQAPNAADVERVYLVRAEKVYLVFSLLDYFRGLPPVYEIRLEEGRWNSMHRRPSGWWDLFTESLTRSPEPGAATDPRNDAAADYLRDDVRIRLRDLRIDLEGWNPGRNVQAPRLRFDLTYEHNPEGGGHIQMEIRAEQELGGRLRAHGSFDARGAGRLHFSIEDMKLEGLAAAIDDTPLVPVELAGDDAPLRIRGGELNGEGSFDSYVTPPGGEEAVQRSIGLNFTGRYRRTGLSAGDGENTLVAIEETGGRIHYNGGYIPDPGEGRHRDEHTGAYFELSVESRRDPGGRRPYTLDVAHYDLPLESRRGEDQAYLSFRGKLLASESLQVKGFSAGELEFDLRFDRPFTRPRYGVQESYPRGSLRISGARPELLDFARAPGSDEGAPPLLIQSANLTLEPGNDERRPEATLKGNVQATLLGGKLEADVSGTAKLLYGPGPAGGPSAYRIAVDGEFDSSLDSLSVTDLVNVIYDGHRSIHSTGSNSETRRAEDLGPVWHNKFYESPLYTTLIGNVDLRGNLTVRSAQPQGLLPPGQNLSARLSNGYLRIDSDSEQLDFRYEANFQALLPRQDFQLRWQVPENRQAFPRFTGSEKPPGSIDLRFSYGGDGVLAGDMIQRSYSRFELEAGNVSLGRRPTLEAIRLQAALPAGETHLDRFQILRSTEGGAVSLRVRGDANDLQVSATGEAIIGYGGELEVRYYIADGAERGNMEFRIHPNGRYVPRAGTL